MDATCVPIVYDKSTILIVTRNVGVAELRQ
jgi:hypothetical protein